jgi:hypothetical protein
MSSVTSEFIKQAGAIAGLDIAIVGIMVLLLRTTLNNSTKRISTVIENCKELSSRKVTALLKEANAEAKYHIVLGLALAAVSVVIILRFGDGKGLFEVPAATTHPAQTSSANPGTGKGANNSQAVPSSAGTTKPAGSGNAIGNSP